jgi:hypothetical protein
LHGLDAHFSLLPHTPTRSPSMISMAFWPPVLNGLAGSCAGLRWDRLPVLMVSATSAWSALTVTCFTVICCWPFAALRITKLRGKSYSDWVEVSAAEKKRRCETLVYALCIRAAFLAAQSDFGNFIDTIAVNALQNWFDPATGHRSRVPSGHCKHVKKTCWRSNQADLTPSLALLT